jgi:hypothetical protein
MQPFIANELARLTVRWPGISFSHASQRWHLPAWPVPPGWNGTVTPLWIPCPSAYPQVPPDNFYVDAALRLADGREPGNSSIAALEPGLPVRLFSFHVEGSEWDPERGDSLEVFLLGIQKRLSEKS